MSAVPTVGGEPPVVVSDVAIQGRDVFFHRPLQDKTWKSVRRYNLPVASALESRGNQIRVSIPKAPHGFFWDLHTLGWEMETKIIDKAGAVPPTDSVIAPINNIGMSIIANLELWLEGVCVTKYEYNSYAVLTYLMALLNYSYMERYAGNLALSGYVPDAPDYEEELDITANTGLEERRRHFGSYVGPVTQKDRPFEFSDKATSYESKLNTNFSGSTQPVPYGISGDLLLTINPASYYMQMENHLREQGYHLDLSTLQFFMEQREMTDAALRAFESDIGKQNTIIDGRRMAIVKEVIRRGDSALFKYNLTSGAMCPQRVAIIFIEEEWEQQASKTPLKFSPTFPGKQGFARLIKVDLIHRGTPLEQTAHKDPATFLKRMYSLYQRTSGYNAGRISGCIPLKDFVTNSFIAFYDCTKSKRASDSADIRQEEIAPPLDLEVEFSAQLETNVIMYAVLEYFADAEITKNNNITYWAYGKP
jgi:hypothetical protein